MCSRTKRKPARLPCSSPTTSMRCISDPAGMVELPCHQAVPRLELLGDLGNAPAAHPGRCLPFDNVATAADRLESIELKSGFWMAAVETRA